MRDAASRSRASGWPNILTYGRIAATPALVACLFFVPGDAGRLAAAAIFALACATDWLDGYLARTLSQQSDLGRMLDPIADKLLVGAALVMLVHDRTIDGWSIWAAVVILCREILVSGLREYLAGLNVRVHVTGLAKFKTGLQMTAIGLLLMGNVGDAIAPGLSAAGLALLWAAAALTLWTGYDYLKAGVSHAMER